MTTAETKKLKPKGDVEFDIHHYIQTLLKWKWLIVVVFVVVVAGVGFWTFRQPKIYQATATVLVDRQAPQVLGSKVSEVVDLSTGNFWRNKEYMETQRKVITSAFIARTVVTELKLTGLKQKTAKAFWANRKASKTFSEDDAVKRLLALIKASQVADANIIEISVEHTNPKLAAKLANAVAKAYERQNLNHKVNSTSHAVKWLKKQADDLKKELKYAELALHKFKKKYNIISVSLDDKQSTVARQMEKITDALTDIRIKRMAIAAQRKQIQRQRQKSGEGVLLAVDVLTDNPTIQKLKDVLVDESRKLASIKERYLGQHPLVLAQKANVDAARQDLEHEVTIVLKTFESGYQRVRDNEAQVAAAMQKKTSEALVLNMHELEYQRLKRTQENAAKLYKLVLTRMKESDLSARLTFNNIRSLDIATVPLTPVRPRVMLVMLLGTVLGLFLAIGLAFLMENFDTSVKSQEDIEKIQGLVYLGMIPRVPGASHQRRGHRPDPKPELDLIVHRDPKSQVAEACRAVRTNLLFASTDKPLRRLVVTSAGPREGKTTSTINIAIAMAQSGTGS